MHPCKTRPQLYKGLMNNKASPDLFWKTPRRKKKNIYKNKLTHLPKAPSSRMTMLQEGAWCSTIGQRRAQNSTRKTCPPVPSVEKMKTRRMRWTAASDVWDTGGVRIMFLKGQFCTLPYYKLAFLRNVPTAVLREIWGPEQPALVFTLTIVHLWEQPALTELLDGVGAVSCHGGYKYESNRLCTLK